MFRSTFGSRLMERNPLQIVATTKVEKLNQIVGMLRMFKIDTFFSAACRPRSWEVLHVAGVEKSNVRCGKKIPIKKQQWLVIQIWWLSLLRSR